MKSEPISEQEIERVGRIALWIEWIGKGVFYAAVGVAAFFAGRLIVNFLEWIKLL